MTRWRAALAAAAAAAAACGSAAQDGSILELDGAPARRAVVAVSAQPPPEDLPPTPMLRRLAGVLDVLEGPRLRELTACVPRDPPAIGRPPDAQTIGYLHLRGGERSRVLEVSRDPTGLFVAEEVGEFDGRPPRAELNGVRFGRLSEGWAAYLGGFDGASVGDPVGRVFELARPYTAHRVFLDRRTAGDRLVGGERWRHEPCERDLAEETFHARLPAGYDPRRPAGVLVWIDPTDQGRIPETFHQAADELNLICLGAAGAGNRHPIVRRVQLALDAAATASRRWHTDPQRVYVTGMSGGGRLSSIALGCFPDVFTGAVPIAGLSVYRPVPMGTGSYWRPEYARPRLFALFKTRRLCAITGDGDFNQPEMVQGAAVLKDDGVPARLVEVAGLGHEMPAAPVFLEAIRWVDEPARLAAAEREERAAELLRAHPPPPGGALGDEVRRALERATEEAPWGESAWRAAAALR